MRVRNVAGLALLGPAAEQDYNRRAVLSEIHPQAWADVDPRFEDTASDPFTLEKLPCSIRVKAVSARAAAGSSRPSNHCPKGLVPSRLTYALIVVTRYDGNT